MAFPVRRRVRIRRVPKYYLDTSVLNFALADDVPAHRDATRAFLAMIRGGEVEGYISDVVLREVSRAPEPRREGLQRLILDIRPTILDVTDEAFQLADRYLAEGIFPRRYENDALHVAVAVVNALDCVVSWNFRHIVRPATRRLVNSANGLLGYGEVEIASPEEVV